MRRQMFTAAANPSITGFLLALRQPPLLLGRAEKHFLCREMQRESRILHTNATEMRNPLNVIAVFDLAFGAEFGTGFPGRSQSW